MFHDQVKSLRPSEIVDMMYTIGPIPMEDEKLLKVSELAGKRVEATRRDSKSGDKATKKEQIHKDIKATKIKYTKDNERKTIK
jgi:hypothetical protein